MFGCLGKIITSVLFGVASCIVFLLTRGDMFQRKVSVELNPGLTPPWVLPPGVNLVHVRGLGQSDTLHFLLCNHGAPALLMVNTYSPQSSVQVDWPSFINRSSPSSLKVEPQTSVRYSRALMFTRVWEYDDVRNTADPQQTTESSFYPPYELQNFIWSDPKITVNQSGITVTLCGGVKMESFVNGSLCLQFSAFESVGRDQMWPNLRHNANSSQLRMWMDSVTPRGNHSRFALEFQSVGDSVFRERTYDSTCIDDEYKPYFFQVSNWVSVPVNGDNVWGYNQWKPVAYRKPEPDPTPCTHSELVSVDQIPQSHLVQAYFIKDPQTYGLNISFGIPGDPVFYNDTKYISWTVLMGLGVPLGNSFYNLHIAFIPIGIVILLFIFAVDCACKRTSGYTRI
ncbi:glycosylated lysosomal membrane protein-like [Carassius carassius]|uniref:glycosylated lysosomal membrane protein-like n=1 Tax=Carassius carassius TaxID=217509 RepID=UPI0028685373|nr:glycosylated lysosomal membrane protein-like [Carassius carassius]